MIEEKTLYRCDPDRNTECRKTICFRHGGFGGMVCRLTKNPEFAARDEAGNMESKTARRNAMRLIDADAYAAEMKKRQDACMEAMENASYEGEQFSPKEHWEGVLAAFAEAKLTLDDMPTVGGWISVKDRLPGESGRVLTLSTAGVVSAHEYSAKWKSFNSLDLFTKERNEELNINNHIAYWLPLSVLPEPPKEVTGDA